MDKVKKRPMGRTNGTIRREKGKGQQGAEWRWAGRELKRGRQNKELWHWGNIYTAIKKTPQCHLLKTASVDLGSWDLGCCAKNCSVDIWVWTGSWALIPSSQGLNDWGLCLKPELSPYLAPQPKVSWPWPATAVPQIFCCSVEIPWVALSRSLLLPCCVFPICRMGDSNILLSWDGVSLSVCKG